MAKKISSILGAVGKQAAKSKKMSDTMEDKRKKTAAKKAAKGGDTPKIVPVTGILRKGIEEIEHREEVICAERDGIKAVMTTLKENGYNKEDVNDIRRQRKMDDDVRINRALNVHRMQAELGMRQAQYDLFDSAPAGIVQDPVDVARTLKGQVPINVAPPEPNPAFPLPAATNEDAAPVVQH